VHHREQPTDPARRGRLDESLRDEAIKNGCIGFLDWFISPTTRFNVLGFCCDPTIPELIPNVLQQGETGAFACIPRLLRYPYFQIDRVWFHRTRKIAKVGLARC
jgi:hypothetical protein